MPLMRGKSKEAFGHNVSAEMEAGKPRDQALAIAYAIRRRNQKKYMGGKVEGYAEGGEVPRETIASRIMAKRSPLEELSEEPADIEGVPVEEDMHMRLNRALEGDEMGALPGEEAKMKRRELIRKALRR